MINIVSLILLTGAAIGTFSICWQIVLVPMIWGGEPSFPFSSTYDPVRNLVESIRQSSANASMNIKSNPHIAVGFGVHINVMANDELLNCVRRETGMQNPFEVFAKREVEQMQSADEETAEEIETEYVHLHAPRIYVNDSRLWGTYVNCIKSGAQTHNPAGAAFFFAHELVARGYKVLLGANPGKFLVGMLPRRIKVPYSKSFFSEDVHILVRSAEYQTALRAALVGSDQEDDHSDHSEHSEHSKHSEHSQHSEAESLSEELVELHNDVNNGHLQFLDGDFQRSFEDFDPRAVVVTGLRALVGFEHDKQRIDGVFERLETFLSRLPMSMRVHYDVECLSDALMRRVVRQVIPYVDSLSVAEPEIDLLNAFLLYGERRSVDPEELRNGNLTEVLDIARSIFMTLTKNSLRNGRRKLTRLHVNSDQFQFVLREFDSFRPKDVHYWDNLENAVASSCNMVFNASCALLGTSSDAVMDDAEVVTDNGQKVRAVIGLRGEFHTTAMPFSLYGKMRRVLPNDRVFCWRERLYDFCSAPCPRCVAEHQTLGETRSHENHTHVYHHHIDLNWPLISAHALSLQL